MKKAPKSLLNTKIKDLLPTPEQQMGHAREALGAKASEAEVLKEADRRAQHARALVAQMERPLGTHDRPFPMWGTQHVELDGSASLVQRLSSIRDNNKPMAVYSDRPYKEVMAMAYCDMVVPSMLPLFFDGLERRKPASTNRTQFVIGDPGHGKSFMGAMQGRLRSKAPVEVFDCGGKNMNELLFEMVLDFGAGEALPTALDKRLKAGTLQALSEGLLTQLGADFVTKTADGKLVVDWEKLRIGSTERIEKAYDLLSKISKIEGLDNAGGNALGMNSQYGPLIRWFIEGREGVLDEYNKSREGGDNALQTVWQFLIGEISTCTIDNPLKNKDTTSGPSSFTFRRDDMQAGFFVTLTGNKREDGVTTRSLNQSVYSRLSPQTLPDPQLIDWQHRICQMLVGLPVSTLYATMKDQADKDPAAFGDWLLYLRRTKAGIEGVPVPALQENLLQNWQSVLHSSENLAKFYDTWATMTNAEKILTEHSYLVDEVDEEYSKKEHIDMRKIKQHLEEAIPIRPRMQPYDAPVVAVFGNWDKQPELGEKEEENPSLAFGTRLVEFLERMVYEKTGAIGKNKLYKGLREAMVQCNLRSLKLTEATHSGLKSVEEDLNISSFADKDLGKQAVMARQVFCNYIRQVDPQVTAEDDQIITLKRMRDALDSVSRKNTAETKEMFVVNRDHATLGSQPLAGIRLEDAALYSSEQELHLSIEDLVDYGDFMASLALPTVGVKNIDAIWESNLRPLMKDDPSTVPANQNDATDDADIKTNGEVFNMAEGVANTGLVTTTLRVAFGTAGDERDVSVHIVKNTLRGKMLVVGEKLPSKLRMAFKEAGIVHVDRHDQNAEAKVVAALNDLTRNLPAGLISDPKRLEAASKYSNATAKTQLMYYALEGAFKFRNDVEKSDKRGIAELLVDGDIGMKKEKFLVKGHKKAM